MDTDTITTDLGDASTNATASDDRSLKTIAVTGVVIGAAVAAGAMIVYGCATVAMVGWRKTNTMMKNRSAKSDSTVDAEPMAQAA